MSLIFPMFAMVLLTVIVGAVAFRARLRALRGKEIRLSYFQTMSGEAPPEYVLKSTRHFNNLFEVPVLFYAGCLAAMVTQVNGPLILTCAWLFVFFRFIQAFIHIGYNNVKHRALVYFAGVASVLAMWFALALYTL